MNHTRHRPSVRRALRAGAQTLLALALIGAAAKAASPQGFLVRIEASQIGLAIDALRGRTRTVALPGYHLQLPWAQQMIVLDKGVLETVLKPGNVGASVPEGPTTVRAKDGSRFWFEDLQVQYQLEPERAAELLEHLGADPAAPRDLVQVAARAAIAEQHGRFEAAQAADPVTTDAAKLEARSQLAAELAPLGVSIVQITTPKPRFEREYEQAVDQRRSAVQDLEKVEGDLAQLGKNRAKLLQRAADETELARKVQSSQATQQISKAGAAELERRGKADAYAAQREAAATARAHELLAQAEALADAGAKNAEGLRAKVEAIGLGGATAVREELVKRLASVEFTLTPFLQDPAPRSGAIVAQGGQP